MGFNLNINLFINRIKGITNSNISISNNSSNADMKNLSAKNQKSSLTKFDKQNLIGQIDLPELLIERTFSKENNQITDYWNYRNKNFRLDNEVLTDFSRIILLGNPGIGKSIELKSAAVKCWENQDDKYIPIFKNLRNFTSQDKIETILNVDWESYRKVFFIFDGIDEIPDAQDFISKLQTFLDNLDSKFKSKNESIKNNKKNKEEKSLDDIHFSFKILISCRTNVFSKEIITLSNFDVFFLNNLNIEQGVSFVKKETGFNIRSTNDISSNLKSFLTNPNSLNILCKYIKTTNKLPENTSELWSIYIEQRLKNDSIFKLLKKRIKKPLIRRYSEKLAFVNELTNSAIISEFNLGKIFNNISDFEDFIKSPLIDKDFEEDNWFFEHKEIQEYFAAQILIQKYNSNLIDVIKLKGFNKTKPTLFNTITFLINLLDKTSDNYKDLINWLIEYEPEMLFRADSDRIDEKIRIKVFQKFFTEKCINTTLWLTTIKDIDIEKTSKFADCDDNFRFLIDKIKDDNIHFRPKISAIEVLAYFRFSEIKKNVLKDCFYKLLESNDISKSEKASIIDFFSKNIDCKYDESIISDIIEVFRLETNNHINSSLLSLVKNSNNIDKYSDYIIEEYLRANEYKKRLDDSDNVGRGNSYNSIDLVFKLNSFENFLTVLKHYFESSTNSHFETTNKEKLIERIVYFCSVNDENIIRALRLIKNDVIYFPQEDILYQVIEKTRKTDIALFYLLENKLLKNIGYFTAKLVTNDNLKKVVTLILSKEQGEKEIQYFRNVISNTNDRDLAVEFEYLMKKEGVVFTENVLTKVEIDDNTERLIQKRKDYFVDFFNKEKILTGIESFFIINNFNNLNVNELNNYEHNLRKKDNYHFHNFFNSSMSIISTVLYKTYNSLSSQEVIDYLKDDFLIFKKIKENITKFKSNNWEYPIEDSDIEKIKNWCVFEFSNIDYDKIIILNNRFSYSVENYNLEKIKLIIFFQKEFKFKLSKDFYLNYLEYYEIHTDGEKSGNLNYLIDQINNKDLFDEKIVYNILNRDMYNLALISHINYALDNKLVDAYSGIRLFFIKNDPITNHNKDILEKYVEVTEDKDVLKASCISDDLSVFWDSIDIMISYNLELEFCYEKSLEFLNLELNTHLENKLFEARAINNLFRLNKVEAIRVILEDLKSNGLDKSKRGGSFIDMKSYTNYDVIDNYEDLKVLFIEIYRDDISDRYVGNDYRTFFRQYILNLTSNYEGYKNIKIIMENIKNQIEQRKEELFYINLILEEIENNYYSSKTKPYKFDEALTLVNDMI
jgi:hypothetical protein